MPVFPQRSADSIQGWSIDGFLVNMELRIPADSVARFNILSSVVVGVTAVAVLISPSVTAAMAGFALAFASTVSHDLLFLVSICLMAAFSAHIVL